jgi:ornithine decarboxylase
VPRHVAVEPGRYLVAESSVMVAGVIGRESRAGENWLYLDVGAYNGLIETQQTANRWSYPLWSSLANHADAPHEMFTVTGPTCDSSDTMFLNEPLPASIDVGDSVYVGSAGAYTLSYASSFNGFPPPSLHCVDGSR